MRKQRYISLWIIAILMILFIFYNSLQTGTSSGSLSETVTRFLMQFVNEAGFSINFDTFHHYVRKLAHFTEYFILGAWITMAANVYPLTKRKRLQPFPFLIAVPVIDETIQHFVPGRYGCISDVLIDISGFLTGMLCLYIILLIIKDIRSLIRG